LFWLAQGRQVRAGGSETVGNYVCAQPIVRLGLKLRGDFACGLQPVNASAISSN
jgi:hypothetical protein